MNHTEYTAVSTKPKDQAAGTPSPTFRSSWWSRRTLLERGLIVLFLLSIIVAIVLIIVVSVFISSQSSQSSTENTTSSNIQQPTCMTSKCVQTAARILNAMDSNVNPCDDFFEYACGSWNRKNVIPEDRANYNTFGKLRDELQTTLKVLLEAPTTEDEPSAIQKAKHLYKSCLNMDLIEKRGDKPLLDLIDYLGGWPVLDPDWDEDKFDWIELVAKLRLHNNKVLLHQWVNSDDKNSNVNIIQLDQMPLGMPSRDYYLKERENETLLAYQQFAIDVAMILGASEERATREMTEAVQFETELANITIPMNQRRDMMANYHRYHVHELYTNITQDIDWLRYLNLVFSNISHTVTMDDEVVVYAPAYMENMADLLKATPKRIVANYVMWRMIKNRVGNMPKRFLDLRTKFNKAMYGTDSDRARWRSCVHYTNENFGMAVGRLFVAENFEESAKTNALEMIGNIREAFKDLLEEVEWMDDKTRQVAREKAESISEKIGYPDYIMNNTALNQDYKENVIGPETYFENVMSNLHVTSRNNMKNIREPVDRSKWSTTPAVINAFYHPPTNRIMFPAGILQPPFYNENYPKSLNFGGIAMVIGHEITHGFDDKGRQFDKDGNLVQWWSNNVIEKFKTKAQCIIDQYAGYNIPEIDMNLNGHQTQGENIADNGGLKQAFRAYRQWVSTRGREEDLLPGIDLNHNQLFFLSFAQIWCGNERPKSYVQAIRSGRHSPGRFRVVGALSNSYDFAKAFQCPAGSKMNPEKKCAVW